MTETEDEAKTKWCPFARCRSFGSEASVNRPFPGDAAKDVVRTECCCIASACMAWRRETETTGIVSAGQKEAFSYTGRGYCGIAGAP